MQMIIDQLHQLYPNLIDLRMREIRVDRMQRKVTCNLSYPFSPVFDENVKYQITDFIRRQMPAGYSCQVKFADDTFTESSFSRNLVDYLRECFPIFSNITRNNIKVHILGRNITVEITVDAFTKQNIESSDFVQKISEHYAEYTCYTVSLLISEEEIDDHRAGVKEQEKLVQLAINKELLRPSRYFHIDSVHMLYGKNITGMPMYITDLRNPLDSCILCGKVSNKRCRRSKTNALLQIASFSLGDGTSSIQCVVFVRLQVTDVQAIMDQTGQGEAEAKTLAEKRQLSNDKKLKGLFWLADGMSVVVRGKLVMGQRGMLEMHVYDLGTCRISPVDPAREFNREPSTDYLLIQPERFSEYRQENFVEQVRKESMIDGKKYAVLHVNGTGFISVAEDKIFAVCATKVYNGNMTERFFTYVNPERHIREERILSQCKTENAQLIFHPTLTEIIGDLYKFLHGCILVGNDLEQIIRLLNYYAAPLNYQFTNETVEQTDFLETLASNSTFDTHVNYSKPDDIAKKCKIPYQKSAFCFDNSTLIARCMCFLANRAK